MFGIAWGVGSLLLLAGVGEGFRNGNRKQLETFGKNIIFFFGGRAPAVDGSFNSAKWFNLTYDDYLAIKNESKLAINISPLIARDDIRAVSDYTSTNGQVSGVPLPQPDLAARQRVGPGVDLHAPGSAGESLYVAGRSAGHDATLRWITDRSIRLRTIITFYLVGRQGLEP